MEELLLLPRSAHTCSSHPSQGLSSPCVHPESSFLSPQPARLQTPALLPTWQSGTQSQKNPSSTSSPSWRPADSVCLPLNLPHHSCSALMLHCSLRCTGSAPQHLSVPRIPDTWFQGRGTCSWSPPPWRQGGCGTSPSTARCGAQQPASEKACGWLLPQGWEWGHEDTEQPCGFNHCNEGPQPCVAPKLHPTPLTSPWSSAEYL